ncbi:MAG: 3-deoxy-D-manno-octulosonic acid transferase [Candidatus Omnitrophota bacterium]|nr:MAG: 3-deoxy-D-manno-octulosonic acid transferase [Candidatus Omnitrophota bacterium]
MRLGIYPDELKDRLSRKNNIWIHAVSVGEIMVAKILVDMIKKDLSQHNIVISTVTETGNSVARKIMSADATIIYLPLDITFAIERAIELIRPVIFIIIETEIWPNLIRRLYKKSIPILLSNGRISPNSYRWYLLIKPILKNILDCITSFYMRTEEDRNKIISLGAEAGKVDVSGNMKFDSVDFHINEEERVKMYELLNLEHRKLIVAGSTHPGEEEIILKAYDRLKKKYNDISLLIAPRHIERTEDVAKLVKSHNFTAIKISELTYDLQLTTASARTNKCEQATSAAEQVRRHNYPVYILDTIGQLKLFYSLAWIVFVGGSLIKHGGQNMIEPACFGKPILFGPYTFNFKDIAALFLSKKVALLVKDEASLAEAIEMMYRDETLAKDMGERVKGVVRNNQGAAARTYNAIKTILQY